MGRIRTIKPEFWKSEALSALPESVHMLAAALLNYSDDYGYFNANPMLIKAECFPLREPSVSVHDGLTMLSNIGYLHIGSIPDGRRYGRIVNFSVHQKVNRPSGSKISELPIEWDDSVSPHGVFTEHSLAEQGTGNREQGKESDDLSGCPHKEILALYHDTLPNLRTVRAWTPARQEMLRARWKEDAERQNLDWWKEFFQRVAGSDFLTGKSTGDRPFEADMEWLVRPQNFVKVIEGKYDNKKKADPYATANRV
jgi:hypothetical protein